MNVEQINQSSGVYMNTKQDVKGKKEKAMEHSNPWRRTERQAGWKGERRLIHRDDRGNRERRAKGGEIVKRDIDDLLLALKPCCSCLRITQRQEHLLYPAAATWTWQGLSDILDNVFLTHTHTQFFFGGSVLLHRLDIGPTWKKC